jgi:hypothetical protein
MVAPRTPARAIPPQVWVAALLTLLLAQGACVLSLPLCLSGLFVGLHILLPGIALALLGPVLILAALGLLRRLRWVRWFLMMLSGCIAIALPMWIALECWKSRTTPAGPEYEHLAAAALFAVIALNLASQAMGVWLADRGSDCESDRAK